MVNRLDNITNISEVQIPEPNIFKNQSDFEVAVESYIQRLTEKALAISTEPYSVISGLTINDFFQLVQNALVARQNSQGVAEDKRLLFLEEESPEEIDAEAITFEIKERHPGSFSQGPPGQGKVKELTGHVRTSVIHPNSPGERVVTIGKKHDHLIAFYVYARTNKQARERLVWFEQVMDAFFWYFKVFGFMSVYQGSTERERFKLGELKLTRYPIYYYVGNDETYHINQQELRDIDIQVSLSKG